MEDKSNHFDKLRPMLGHPSKKIDLQTLDNKEKQRQEEFGNLLNELKTNTMVKKKTRKISLRLFTVKHFRFFQEEIQANSQMTVQSFASNAERLLIIFDDLLTADEIVRTSKFSSKFN